MKKGLVLVLTMVFVLALAGSAFAAANPFVDVPAKHWAYDAVSKLAKDGIIDGYGDGTFRGDRTMTRYEMAQVVAKAMAYQGKITAEQKAMIDKLAVEFSTELQNLGVRVGNIEAKLNKMPSFNGEVRLQYRNDYYSNNQLSAGMKNAIIAGNNVSGFNGGYAIAIPPSDNYTDYYQNDKGVQQNWARIRLYLQGNVNDNWTYNARLVAYSDAKYGYENTTPGENGNLTSTGTNGVMRFDYGFLKGSYNNWKIYLGKFADTLPFAASMGKDDGGFGINPAAGLINDNWLTGVRVAYNADKFKANVYYGSEQTPAIYDPTTGVFTSLSMASPFATIANVGSFGGWENNFSNYANRNTANMFGIDLGYALAERLNIYYGYFQMAAGNGSFGSTAGTVTQNGNSVYTANQTWGSKSASYWQAGLDYKINKQFLLSGFVGGSNAKMNNSAWVARVDYSNSGSYIPNSTKVGSWSLYAFYQYLGRYSAWVPTYDIFNINGLGSKGWTWGVNYVWLPNTLLNFEYSTLSGAQSGTAPGAFADTTGSGSANKYKLTFDYFF